MRNERQGEEALAAVLGAETVVIGDPRLMIVNRMRAPTGPEQFAGRESPLPWMCPRGQSS